jgi:hypothetical protein
MRSNASRESPGSPRVTTADNDEIVKIHRGILAEGRSRADWHVPCIHQFAQLPPAHVA